MWALNLCKAPFDNLERALGHHVRSQLRQISHKSANALCPRWQHKVKIAMKPIALLWTSHAYNKLNTPKMSKNRVVLYQSIKILQYCDMHLRWLLSVFILCTWLCTKSRYKPPCHHIGSVLAGGFSFRCMRGASIQCNKGFSATPAHSLCWLCHLWHCIICICHSLWCKTAEQICLKLMWIMDQLPMHLGHWIAHMSEF